MGFDLTNARPLTVDLANLGAELRLDILQSRMRKIIASKPSPDLFSS